LSTDKAVFVQFRLLCMFSTLILDVHKYKPMGSSYYIQLPDYIKNIKELLSNKTLSFNWDMFYKYNFSDQLFTTPIRILTIFEKNNVNLSVNAFHLTHANNKRYISYLFKYVDEEKR